MPVPSYQYIYSDDIPTSSELEIAATATDGHPTTFYVLSSDANRKTYETRDLYRERLQTACDQVLEWPAVSCGGGPLLTDEAKALKRNLADGKITMAEYCNTEKTLQSIDEFSKVSCPFLQLATSIPCYLQL